MSKRRFDVELHDLDDNQIMENSVDVVAVITLVNNVRNWVSSDIQEKIDGALKGLGAGGLTLKKVAISALLGAYADEQATLNDAERFRRMELARRIHNADDGVVDLKSEDITLVKSLISKRYPGVVVPVLAGELLEKELPPSDAPAAS